MNIGVCAFIIVLIVAGMLAIALKLVAMLDRFVSRKRGCENNSSEYEKIRSKWLSSFVLYCLYLAVISLVFVGGVWHNFLNSPMIFAPMTHVFSYVFIIIIPFIMRGLLVYYWGFKKKSSKYLAFAIFLNVVCLFGKTLLIPFIFLVILQSSIKPLLGFADVIGWISLVGCIMVGVVVFIWLPELLYTLRTIKLYRAHKDIVLHDTTF